MLFVQVVLEGPATYEENCCWMDLRFVGPQHLEVLKEDEAVTKEFHRSALSIQERARAISYSYSAMGQD